MIEHDVDIEVTFIPPEATKPWVMGYREDNGKGVLIPADIQRVGQFQTQDRFVANVVTDAKGCRVVRVVANLPPAPPLITAHSAEVTPIIMTEPTPDDYAVVEAAAAQRVVRQASRRTRSALEAWSYSDADGNIPPDGTEDRAIYELRKIRSRCKVALESVDNYFDTYYPQFGFIGVHTELDAEQLVDPDVDAMRTDTLAADITDMLRDVADDA
jgi:hypothetical protein